MVLEDKLDLMDERFLTREEKRISKVKVMDIDTVPDRSFLYRFKEMTRYSTIWPQVHAS